MVAADTIYIPVGFSFVRIKEAAWLTFLVAIVSLFFLWGLFYLLFNRTVVLELKGLLSTFRNIPGPTNSDDVVLPLTSGDEVDQLKRAFEIAALELQQTHNNLKASETKYRLMFEASQDTIIIIDDQERVRDINSAGIALFGFMDRAEALRSAESGKAPDIEALVQASDIPAKTRQGYRPWVTLLVEHYRDLLLAHGSSYPALVKSTYKTRTNYLLFLNRLNQVEQDFDSALKPHLETSTEDVNGIIKLMEESVTSLRRQLAEAIFP